MNAHGRALGHPLSMYTNTVANGWAKSGTECDAKDNGKPKRPGLGDPERGPASTMLSGLTCLRSGITYWRCMQDKLWLRQVRQGKPAATGPTGQTAKTSTASNKRNKRWGRPTRRQGTSQHPFVLQANAWHHHKTTTSADRHPMGVSPGRNGIWMQTLQPCACRTLELQDPSCRHGPPVVPASGLSALQEERACCHSCFSNVGARPCRSDPQLVRLPCSSTFCKA